MIRQLELWKWVNREIQPGERLAITPVLSPAHGKVTSHVKPGERRCRAAGIKSKELSPETAIVGKADKLYFSEGSIATPVKGEKVAPSPGSKIVARRFK